MSKGIYFSTATLAAARRAIYLEVLDCNEAAVSENTVDPAAVETTHAALWDAGLRLAIAFNGIRTATSAAACGLRSAL